MKYTVNEENEMKVSIELQMPEAKPLTKEERLKKLLDKVEYAGDCIDANHRKEQAICFLQDLYAKLERVPRLTEELETLKEECYKRVRDYGLKPLLPKEGEE